MAGPHGARPRRRRRQRRHPWRPPNRQNHRAPLPHPRRCPHPHTPRSQLLHRRHERLRLRLPRPTASRRRRGHPLRRGQTPTHHRRNGSLPPRTRNLVRTPPNLVGATNARYARPRPPPRTLRRRRFPGHRRVGHHAERLRRPSGNRRKARTTRPRLRHPHHLRHRPLARLPAPRPSSHRHQSRISAQRLPRLLRRQTCQRKTR